MKKLTPIFIFLFSVCHVMAQTEPKPEKKHEVKLNALYLIVGAVDVKYEYLLNEESGVGISVAIPFDGEVSEDVNYEISPYYRFYFGKKYAAGFFLEGFGMLNSFNEYHHYHIEGGIKTEEETITDFALGIGLGGKWVTKRGFVGEVNFGIGRNLFNGSEYAADIVAKLGITIGYRF